MTNSCSNKVSLGKKPEKRYTFEIIWVNYVIMNPFLKTLMYGVGSARRLRILYLDLDLFNKKTYIYTYIKFIQQRSYVNIFLFEVGLLQLPLSPPQKLNTLRLLGSIIK